MERPEPDLRGIADRRVRRRIEKAVERSILEPVFETVVQRTTRHLHAAEGELELALDDGIVRAGGSENSLCEAELELKSGNPECLLQTAAQLFAASPVRLAKGSQAERGYSLALGKANGRVEPQRSEPPRLGADHTCAQAFARIVQSAAAQIAANRTPCWRRTTPTPPTSCASACGACAARCAPSARSATCPPRASWRDMRACWRAAWASCATPTC